MADPLAQTALKSFEPGRAAIITFHFYLTNIENMHSRRCKIRQETIRTKGDWWDRNRARGQRNV